MRGRAFAVLPALTIALVSWTSVVVACLDASDLDNIAIRIEDAKELAAAGSVKVEGAPVDSPSASQFETLVTFTSDDAQAAPDGEVSVVNLADADVTLQLVSVSPSAQVNDDPTPPVGLIETPIQCLDAERCIDQYLWLLYERTPKVDTNKVSQRIKVAVKKKTKTRSVIKSMTKYVVADFTWKDPLAARKAGMSLIDYVIGGMDRRFKLKLYHALRAMDGAGLMPGITSAFRDNYRQSIASGRKAAADSSYHGGSRRGGYGHGLAADLVSVNGETRMQRFEASQVLWKWIDAHEKELGIGRPYRDRDPPHVGPIDGKEYVMKRGRRNVRNAGWQKKTTQKRS